MQSCSVSARTKRAPVTTARKAITDFTIPCTPGLQRCVRPTKGTDVMQDCTLKPKQDYGRCDRNLTAPNGPHGASVGSRADGISLLRAGVARWGQSMKARQLITSASYDPDQVKVLGQAFDMLGSGSHRISVVGPTP